MFVHDTHTLQYVRIFITEKIKQYFACTIMGNIHACDNCNFNCIPNIRTPVFNCDKICSFFQSCILNRNDECSEGNSNNSLVLSGQRYNETISSSVINCDNIQQNSFSIHSRNPNGYDIFFDNLMLFILYVLIIIIIKF